jgi:acyl carrier protein
MSDSRTYNWDDLHTLLGIYIAIEKWFGIELSDNEIDAVETIDQLVDLVTKKLKEE